jgi:RND family efflux transporter MFP subunit
VLRVLILMLSACVLNAVEIEGFSAPSADATLSFIRSGQIIEVTVKKGDKIKAGQLLARLDDSLEKTKLSQLQEELRHEAKINVEKAKLTQKKKDLLSLEEAAKDGATSIKEVDTARLEVVQLEYSIKILYFEKSQLSKQIDEQKILQKQTQLIALEDGIVEDVSVERGESIERLNEIFRIVRIDPLWVEVNIPLDKSKKLKLGAELQVLFPNSDSKETIKKGKIIYRSSIADPGSETLRFRLEIENSGQRLAGERVKVRLEN